MSGSASAPDPGFFHSRLEPLRQRILAASNDHCFVERQQILGEVARTIDPVPPEYRYSCTLERLLTGLSTPIEPADVLLGRMVEGLPREHDGPWAAGLPFFRSPGHTTLDWPRVLREGLRAVAQRARRRASERGDSRSGIFADNIQRCCDAVILFSARYADAARAAAGSAAGEQRRHLQRLAAALEQAPAGPATSLGESPPWPIP